MFTETTKARFPSTHWILLERLTHVIGVLRQSQGPEAPFPKTTDPLIHFNAYVDFSLSIYFAKLLQLFEAIEYAVENERYLIYAQSGRAILENVATLRYYSRHADFIAASQAWKSSTLTDAVLRQASTTLDRFARGNRFSWDAFIEGNMQALSKTPDQEHLAQINSSTCLAKWFTDSPKLAPLYDLLCDLVHPNLGSNLLVLGVHGDNLVAGSHSAKSTAMFIIAPTLAGILSTFKEFSSCVAALAALRFFPRSSPPLH